MHTKLAYRIYRITMLTCVVTLLITEQFFGMIAASLVLALAAIYIVSHVYAGQNMRRFAAISTVVVLWYMTAMVLLIAQTIQRR